VNLLQVFSREGREAKDAYVWTFILNTPFWAIYNLFPFIVLKDLGATPFQVTLMIALKPAVSILSVYWNDCIGQKPGFRTKSVTLGTIFSHLPFFFFPWIENVWFFVASFAIYMLFYRGVMPAWIEILKQGTKKGIREKIIAFTLTLSHLGTAFFPYFFGWVMDDFEGAWRYIFPLTSAISLLAIYFQLKIPEEELIQPVEPPPSFSRPWKKMWSLLLARPDYRRYQIAFMLGGGGIMIIQPALPDLCINFLKLNYKELGLAISMCKGIGFALTSGFWASWVTRLEITRFSALVFFLFSLFPLALCLSIDSMAIFYFAWLAYGAMQAGGNLAWKLSGPIFAEDLDSSLYSSVNVLTVGIRGLTANPLGGLLNVFFGPIAVMWVGFALCFSGGLHLFLTSRVREIKTADG